MHGESLQEFPLLILEAVPQPVWVVDAAGDILFANRAAVDALGYEDGSELIGLPSHTTVHHSHGDGSPFPADQCRMLRPALTGVQERGDDYWFARKDGTLFPIAWWSAPIELAEGRGVVTAFTDLTERRRAEDLKRELAEARIRAADSREAQRRVIEATAEVRRRTAQDLHDGAQQRLVSLAILLQLASEQVATAPDDATALLKHASAETKAAIDELRELAAGMYPATLASGGLPAAIDSLAMRCAIPVVTDVRLERRLDPAVEAHAYFIVSEALTNATKHAAPSRIDVVARADRALELTVADDGVGGVDARRAGTGLTGMRDRVTALGGRLTVTSPRGGGTTLRVTVPLG
jgi:PAS domain S-box-containing protein